MTADLDYKKLPLGELNFDKDISGVINHSLLQPPDITLTSRCAVQMPPESHLGNKLKVIFKKFAQNSCGSMQLLFIQLG